MVPDSDSRSLGEDIVHRWKEELFSADTVVALVAVAVAIPAGLAAGLLVPEAVFPVWLSTAAGPSLGYWRGFRIEVDVRTAAVVGVAMAAAIAVVTTATAVVFVEVVDAGIDLSIAVAAVVGLLFGGLASRLAFHRLAGEGS